MKTAEPLSNIEWRAWGREDPLFGVATCAGKDRNGPAPWTDESFYALGKSDWKDFYQRWQRYGLEVESCVEIGCGTGRITRQLARVFREVHAVDVSPDMLAYARKQVSVNNVHFHLASGVDIPLPDESISAAFSCHVFQHFDSYEVARKYFHEIHRVLQVAGTLMIHLPVHAWPDLPGRFEMLLRWHRFIENVRATVNRALITRGMFRPVMKRLTYPLPWFFAELPKIGFSDIEICMFELTSTRDPHPCVLARKSQP